MALDNSSVSVQGAPSEWDNAQPLPAPSIDDMRYATQVANAPSPTAQSSMWSGLPSLDEASNYLANLPTQAQRFLTNPSAFTEMMTGNNPLPEQTGFAASATGLPAQNPNSLFTPAGMAYNRGYESGEPVSIAAMGLPAAAPAARMLGNAAGERIMMGKSLIPGTNTEYLNPQIMSAVKNKGGNWINSSLEKYDNLKSETLPKNQIKHLATNDPSALTPAQMREELFAKSRVDEAERKANEPRTLEQRMIDQGRLPAKSGSGGSGGDGLLRNEISAKNPVYKSGGSVKIPSMDEMRLTILRNK